MCIRDSTRVMLMRIPEISRLTLLLPSAAFTTTAPARFTLAWSALSYHESQLTEFIAFLTLRSPKKLAITAPALLPLEALPPLISVIKPTRSLS